jgi:protein-S-isoprenylcysteine O-methyltransferase Ste14
MIEKIVAWIAGRAGKPRSRSVRILSLAAGAVVFLAAIPLALGLIGHWAAGYVVIPAPGFLARSLGAASVCAGLFFLLWSMSAFWFVGGGTPVPLASPTRLVTTGPFRYTRNPIKLGAVLYYFGAGAICDGLVTGLVMLILATAIGTIYHKTVEEKELAIRFGSAYEEYRNRTSFLIPLPPKKGKVL